MTLMKNFDYKTPMCLMLIAIVLGKSICSTSAFAQSKDHLSPKEIELIRFYQRIDTRMEIYVKAVERRLLSISGIQTLSAKERKQLQKDKKKWGELPQGSQGRLLTDIEKIIDEAINKIEDVADRNPDSDHFKKAVHILADGSKGFIPRLNAISENTRSIRERALISSSIKNCNLIIEASGKVKNPAKTKKRKKVDGYQLF